MYLSPQALGYTLWFSLFSLKLNIFSFSASILTFSTQNHLNLTYFTHFDTTHFSYKYYNINKATNSPPFFLLLYIMKFHLPRFNSRFLRGKSLSRRNSRGRRFLEYCSVYSTRLKSTGSHFIIKQSQFCTVRLFFLNLLARKSLQLFYGR